MHGLEHLQVSTARLRTVLHAPAPSSPCCSCAHLAKDGVAEPSGEKEHVALQFGIVRQVFPRLEKMVLRPDCTLSIQSSMESTWPEICFPLDDFDDGGHACILSKPLDSFVVVLEVCPHGTVLRMIQVQTRMKCQVHTAMTASSGTPCNVLLMSSFLASNQLTFPCTCTGRTAP
jgi:hypothetical protein